jgi:hypothetical protein
MMRNSVKPHPHTMYCEKGHSCQRTYDKIESVALINIAQDLL